MREGWSENELSQKPKLWILTPVVSPSNSVNWCKSLRLCVLIDKRRGWDQMVLKVPYGSLNVQGFKAKPATERRDLLIK